MPKEEWGVKRACPKCSVRFYDLQKDPMTCPSCGASFDVASLTQQRSRATAPVKEVKKVAEPAADGADAVEDAVVLDDDDDDEVVVADDLGDDLLDDDDDDDDTVALEEIADVPAKDDEN